MENGEENDDVDNEFSDEDNKINDKKVKFSG